MSRGRKQSKKRKRHSSVLPPPPLKSLIGERLEKLRRKRKNLWNDDNDDDEEEEKQSQPKTKKKLHFILPDSDDEKPSSSSQRRLRSSKSSKKRSRTHNESATCLICSILSQLSSYNCCSAHLSILKNHSHHQQQTTRSSRLPEQVMVIPITGDNAQHYDDSPHVHHLRKQTSTSPTKRTTTECYVSTRKPSTKSTISLNHSRDQQQSTKTTPKLSTRSSQAGIRPTASTITIESSRSNSATIPPDVTTTTVTSASPTADINNVDDVTTTDRDQLHQSPIETIIIDDSQQETTLIETTNDHKPLDPWTPISDEIDAALEQALNLNDSSPLEYTPVTARRTETEVMAARLPKIPLKEGRFRNGKPITNRTTSTAASEYRPSAAAQTSPLTASVTTTNVRSPPTVTIVENETSGQMLNRSEHTIDRHHGIFTQDEPSQNNHIPMTTQVNEASTSVTTENSNTEIERNGTHHATSMTPVEKPTTSRISYRSNPDGSRVSVSLPPLPANRQSPLVSSLRRTSTDVTPIPPNSKQV